MSYTQPPNENWLQENQGDTIVLTFPNNEYVVTVHSAPPTELYQDTSTEEHADD